MVESEHMIHTVHHPLDPLACHLAVQLKDVRLTITARVGGEPREQQADPYCVSLSFIAQHI